MRSDSSKVHCPRSAVYVLYLPTGMSTFTSLDSLLTGATGRTRGHHASSGCILFPGIRVTTFRRLGS